MASPEYEPFVPLSNTDIDKLIENLKNCLPRSIHVLTFILNLIDYKKKNPEVKGEIYAPSGDYTDNTVLVTMMSIVGTYYSDTDNGCARLYSALKDTKLFDNVPDLLMTAVHDSVHKSVGTNWSTLVLNEITPCVLFTLSAQDALKLNLKIPDNVVVKDLKEEDAELIDSLWPHRQEGHSVHFIRKVIKMSPSVGIYNRSDNKLLSWVLKWFYGGLGVLQTVEEAKRRGLAQIAVMEQSKRLAKENWPIHATVLTTNKASLPLFDKLGFSRSFICNYIEFKRLIK